MRRNVILIVCAVLVFCSPNKPKVDSNLYGTWLVIGYRQTEQGVTLSERGYSVAQSIIAYRIDNNSLSEYVRGTDLTAIGGGIQFYDSVKQSQYGVSIDDKTISSSQTGNLSYSFLSECGGSFLKLTSTHSGYDPSVSQTVTVGEYHYCIRVLNDSLPRVWPRDSDITIIDTSCTPTQLPSW